MKVPKVKSTQLFRMVLVVVMILISGAAYAANAGWSGFLAVTGGVARENGEAFMANPQGQGI